MKFNKLYSAVYNDDCYPFSRLLDERGSTEGIAHPDALQPQEKTALIIWGGADINPEYYKHPMHSTTHPGGARDRIEWGLVQRAIEIGMPIIGVCRGAQMVCAAAGGFLLQDVENHAGMGHFVHTYDIKSFHVNSIHHQMMAGLEAVDHELVAWRENRQGAPYGWKDDQWYTPPADFKEPEFVYFPKIRAYAIQWHPEGMALRCEATQYILNYIEKKEEEHGAGYASISLNCSC